YYETQYANDFDGVGYPQREPIWDNTTRVTQPNQFVPQAVRLRSGKVSIPAARPNQVPAARPTPVSTGRPKPVSTGKQNRPPPVHAGRRNSSSVTSGWWQSTARPMTHLPTPTSSYFQTSTPFGPHVYYNQMHNDWDGWVTAVKPSAGCSWKSYRNKVYRVNLHTDAGDEGIVDSGCSRSMTGNKERLDDFQPFKGGKVTFGGGEGRITGKGTIRTPKLDFENVYYVKELQQFNLFSVSQICDKKNRVLFTDTDCLVLSNDFKLPDESMVLLRVPRKHNLYTFNLNNLAPKENLACLVAKASSDEAVKWHRRMGHVNYKNMNKLVKDNLVRGLPPKLFKNDHTCVACCKGKQHKATYKAITAVSSISEPLQLLHMDLFGPTSIQSIDHKFWYDRDLINLKLMLQPYYVLSFIIVPFYPSHNIQEAESKDTSGDEVDDSPLDSAEEIFQQELARLKGQEQRATSDAKDAEELQKRASTKTVPPGSIPVPTGSPTDSFFDDEPTTRFPSLSDLGNNESSPGIFSSSSYDDEFGVDLNNLASTVEVSPVATKRINTIHHQSLIIGDHTSAVQTRSKVNKTTTGESAFLSYIHDLQRDNHTDFQHCLFACFLSQVKPKSVAQALEDPSWVDAMQEEMQQFKFQNEEGIDYDEVFAPVARKEAIRLFLAFASYMGFMVYQMDVKSAFLYGKIDEEVYVTQPKGFVDPQHPKKVYKVVKVLYGLHQAPRACKLNESKAQSQEKDTVIKKLKERIKSLSENINKDKVKKDIEEIETINIELDHRVSNLIAENEHLKQTYKQLYDSIKPAHIRSKEQCDVLINQVKQKCVENFDLNAKIQEQGLTIVETIGVKPSTSASGLQPSGNTKKDKIQRTPSSTQKNKVEAHPKTVKSSLKNKNTVVEPKGTANVQHFKLNVNSELLCVTCNGCMLSINHLLDLCVLDFINDVNARNKSKSVKKGSKRKVWKPTGKVFTNIGNACPLTRITTAEVPLRNPTALESDTPKPVVTFVVQIVLWYLDSCCSKHMTGDRSQLTNFVNKFLGTVKFKNYHMAKILGYGDYQIGNVTISKVYYVEGLGHNLFSVGQFCDSNLEVAHLLHSPMRVTSVNGKKYILVIVDDYSRFTWVKCLRSKDEAPDFIIKLGISHETSVARSLQQNGVVERRNCMLIEAARTMLIYEKAPLFLLAEAVATACYTQNRSIIRLCHGKTPYELFNATSDLSFFYVFGATLLYDIMIVRTWVRRIIETIHVDFDELTVMASEHSSSGPALHEMTPAIISSGLLPNLPPSTTVLVSPEPAASTDSPSSTTVDQDAPSPSNSQTTLETQSHIIPNDVEEDNHDLDVVHMKSDPFFGILIPEKDSEASSSLDVIPTVVTRTCFVLMVTVKEEGIDFEESFAPVARLDAIRIFLSYAAHMNMIVYQMDEFSKETVDPTLFIRRQDKDILLISQSPRGIFLNQSKYALESLKKYGMESSDPVDTPMKNTVISNTKAEYIALSGCCAQVLWMRSQLADYGLGFNKIPMYCDNKSVIALCNNNVQHSRSKHIDIRFHFIKEMLITSVELYFVKTEYQLANIFNKALGRERIEFLINKLGMQSFTPETLKQLADEAEE
ncbi:putative ribonuclease H-like domain-containing protein, partial [Tanacetum coccineum]